jgi:hypothetical protein
MITINDIQMITINDLQMIMINNLHMITINECIFETFLYFSHDDLTSL